jgi:hypothetical protein
VERIDRFAIMLALPVPVVTATVSTRSWRSDTVAVQEVGCHSDRRIGPSLRGSREGAHDLREPMTDGRRPVDLEFEGVASAKAFWRVPGQAA